VIENLLISGLIQSNEIHYIVIVVIKPRRRPSLDRQTGWSRDSRPQRPQLVRLGKSLKTLSNLNSIFDTFRITVYLFNHVGWLYNWYLSVRGNSHGVTARGGHGVPKVSPGPTMPYLFTPCGQATPEAALRPFQEWPNHRVSSLRLSSTPLDTPRRTPMKTVH
jgi:hypothetical protein